MSTTQRAPESIFEGCRPNDATPVTIDADDLDTTDTPYLRELKASLRSAGYVTAELTATVCFDEHCSLSTQSTIDDVRALVDAATFLGADTLSLHVSSVADVSKVRPALDACVERAFREGVELDVSGAVSLS